MSATIALSDDAKCMRYMDCFFEHYADGTVAFFCQRDCSLECCWRNIQAADYMLKLDGCKDIWWALIFFCLYVYLIAAYGLFHFA